MDPSAATTLERAAEFAFAWAEKLPLPPRLRLPVLGALGAVLVALVLARKFRCAKVEPPAEADEGGKVIDFRAREGGGPPGGENQDNG